MLAATYAIEFGLTVDDLADTWAPYLTMSEALRMTASTLRVSASMTSLTSPRVSQLANARGMS